MTLATVTLALPLAPGASAAPAPLAAPPNGGLTAPAGAAQTPDGTVWVSDELKGLCRVSSAGTLVGDAFCGAQTEPPAAHRPTGTFQIAFDSAGCTTTTPASDLTKCNFYVAEGTSAGAGVWRMHWNSQTGAIDAAVKIFETFDDNRVFGLALTPEGDVDFSSKRDAIIRRLVDPETLTGPTVPEVVGASQLEGASALAHLGQALYLADTGTLTRIVTPGPRGGVATTVDLGPDVVASALAANPAEGILYVGTNSDKLTDVVLALKGGEGPAVTYETGFANVTGLGLAPNGTLLIGDDPALGAGGVETVEQGRLFARPLTSLDLPRVTLTASPLLVQQSGSPADTTFRFQSRAGATFSCTLDGADVECPADPSGDGTGQFVPGAELAEGAHVFTARATAGGEQGPTTRWPFTIDHTPPTVTIDGPSALAVGGRVTFRFSANERPVTFTCRLDGQPVPCSTSADLNGLVFSPHVFEVFAVDTAGNVSDTARWEFTAIPAPPTPVGPVAPGAPVATPRATRVQTKARVPRIAIHVPCVEVSAPRERARLTLVGRAARITFRAPARARYAKLTLRRATGGRSGARVVETLGYARVRRGGTRHKTSIALTRGQQLRLREGAMRIAIAYGTCRTQVGQWHWLTNTTPKGLL